MMAPLHYSEAALSSSKWIWCETFLDDALLTLLQEYTYNLVIQLNVQLKEGKWKLCG
jgi:hypothetical protein